MKKKLAKVLSPVILGLALTTASTPDLALAAASDQGCLSSGGQANGCVTNSVPVSGSTFASFGVGFLALALWHRQQRRRWTG
jgi:hypothetical protein